MRASELRVYFGVVAGIAIVQAVTAALRPDGDPVMGIVMTSGLVTLLLLGLRPEHPAGRGDRDGHGVGADGTAWKPPTTRPLDASGPRERADPAPGRRSAPTRDEPR
ncbi:hypothetical protein AS850_14735 [Frondihabitans sp. 762G35]|uniref:hypothetical protein n=1 Tax=Frondihabitans sp. 762G35 TaxID=1446794 RepID=UPI000D20E6F9|nr:hypothetical protein [Frondihabitans sp. 762G35]ARC58339.1 hypothetical protein AS850_14735 [Frondihabitans sp. 762G35]